MKNINRKCLLTALALLFISSTLFSQSLSKEQVIKFKILSVSEINDQDELEAYAHYNENGEPIHTANQTSPSIDFTYDAKLLKTETAMSFDGALLSVSKYTYNALKQLTLITKTDANNVVKSKTTIEYDNKGNKVKETYWTPDMSHTIDFTYEGNLLIEEAMSQNTSVRDRMTYYKYDAKGRISEVKRALYSGASTALGTYSYAAAGNLTEIKEDLENGSIITTYKYTSKGLPESVTWKSTLETASHRTRYVIELR